jgi:hypothetical protein
VVESYCKLLHSYFRPTLSQTFSHHLASEPRFSSPTIFAENSKNIHHLFGQIQHKQKPTLSYQSTVLIPNQSLNFCWNLSTIQRIDYWFQRILRFILLKITLQLIVFNWLVHLLTHINPQNSTQILHKFSQNIYIHTEGILTARTWCISTIKTKFHSEYIQATVSSRNSSIQSSNSAIYMLRYITFWSKLNLQSSIVICLYT